jgi:hydrogenase expression/formation protein HypD
MCLGVPAKVLSIEGGSAVARVGDIVTTADITLTPNVSIGDYVMIHAGFSLNVMDQDSVEAALDVFREVGRRERNFEGLVERIETLAGGLGRVRLMEVCGTHTVAIARSGLKSRLPSSIELISGPGCPVCVTPAGTIDMVVELALSGRVRIVSFGDMLRVRGSLDSLESARGRGAQVEIAYSPNRALELARGRPEEIVFLAVGFETTAPIIAAAVKAAAAEGLANFSVLVVHRLIPPALDALLAAGAAEVDGLICPGHVSTVIGANAYDALAGAYNLPFVVAGFEPTDVLEAIAMTLEQLQSGRVGVGNQYVRSVSPEGSVAARRGMDEVFDVVDGYWRGLGKIPHSALALKPAYGAFDAVVKFGLIDRPVPEPPGCRCGAVLSGQARPSDCGLFGRSCTPDRPVGPCMVSSEGACQAAYLYSGAGERV